MQQMGLPTAFNPEDIKRDYAEGFRGWNISVQTYSRAGQINVVDNCFAFMFTNIGDTIAFVNEMVIFPSATPATALGDSRSISGHWMDLYKGYMTLKFQAPLGATPLVEIVQLFYALPYQKNG